jgi:hypothetical protein
MNMHRRSFMGGIAATIAGLFSAKAVEAQAAPDGDWLEKRIANLRMMEGFKGCGGPTGIVEGGNKTPYIDMNSGGGELYLYTEKYKYHIHVKENYLGCTLHCRSGQGMSDLADGRRTPETWARIMEDIVACELNMKPNHRWKAIPPGGPVEECAVCSDCGRYATSQGDEECACAVFRSGNPRLGNCACDRR